MTILTQLIENPIKPTGTRIQPITKAALLFLGIKNIPINGKAIVITAMIVQNIIIETIPPIYKDLS